MLQLLGVIQERCPHLGANSLEFIFFVESSSLEAPCRGKVCRAVAFSAEMTGSFRCQAWECEILFTPPVMQDTPNDAQSGQWLEADGSP